jgi:hypothetical protein
MEVKPGVIVSHERIFLTLQSFQREDTFRDFPFHQTGRRHTASFLQEPSRGRCVFPMTGRIALLAALFLIPFATPLPAQKSEDLASYAEGDYFPLAWHQQFGPPLADCRAFAVYQLNLFAAHQDSAGLHFYRFPLGKDRASAEPERMAPCPAPSFSSKSR